MELETATQEKNSYIGFELPHLNKKIGVVGNKQGGPLNDQGSGSSGPCEVLLLWGLSYISAGISMSSFLNTCAFCAIESDQMGQR
jgi:hypothetical protein